MKGIYSTIQSIQKFHNKVLSGIVNANQGLRSKVADVIKESGKKHEHWLHNHFNVEAIQLEMEWNESHHG